MDGFPVTGNVTLAHLRTLYNGIKARVDFLDRSKIGDVQQWVIGSYLDPGEPQSGGMGWEYKKRLRDVYRRTICELAPCYCSDPTDDDLPQWTAQGLLETSCKAVFGGEWAYPAETAWQQWANPLSGIWPWYTGDHIPYGGIEPCVGHLDYDINVMAAAIDRLSYPLAYIGAPVEQVLYTYPGYYVAYYRSYKSDVGSDAWWIPADAEIGQLRRIPLQAWTISNNMSHSRTTAKWLSSLASGRMRITATQSVTDTAYRALVFAASATAPGLPDFPLWWPVPILDETFFDAAFTDVLATSAVENIAETKDISNAGPYWMWRGNGDTGVLENAGWSATLADNPDHCDNYNTEVAAYMPATVNRIVMLRGGGSLPDEPEDPDEPYEPGWP